MPRTGHDDSFPRPDDAALASCFNVSLKLLPHLDFLLQDFFALGGAPDEVVSLLRQADLPPSAQVLDLGCGKGAVSLAVARAFPDCVAGVTGFDGFAPFVAEAQRRAAVAGLDERCRFHVADLAAVTQRGGAWDIVLYVAVGEALGALDETMTALRRCVRPGGLICVDDGYALDATVSFHGYATLNQRSATLAKLTARGDSILAERIHPPAAQQEQNRLYTERLERRAAELAQEHPELRAELAAYIETQAEECRILESNIECAAWLLRRGADPIP